MIARERVYLDPRTKLLLLVLNSLFLMGGIGGDAPFMQLFRHLLVVILLVFLWLYGRKKQAFLVSLFYIVFYSLQMTIFPHLTGMLNYMLLFSVSLFIRILPTVMAGHLLIGTTKVRDLVAALKKMRVSDALIIPISVIMRFFPVIIEEYIAISSAMAMRGIRFGGSHRTKMLEYRIIPLIICSVKAGEELSAAALVRGLGSPIARTRKDSVRFGKYDYLTMGVILFFFILAIISQVALW